MERENKMFIIKEDATRAVEILRNLNSTLSSEPQGVQKAAWALLSMVRGPDSDNDLAKYPTLKLRTTGIVRREVFPFIEFYGEVATPVDEPHWNIDSFPISSHFAYHAVDAIQVLEMAGCIHKKENI